MIIQLYKDLVKLVTENDSFFFYDQIKDDKIYRIFNYRLALYTDFLLPSALECRGIMFEIDHNDNMIDIKSRPMAKFFNDKENPLVMDLDYSKIIRFMDKADGSLISSYMHNGNLFLKSKGSLSSTQALVAQEYIEKNTDLYEYVLSFAEVGYTVNMEWCSPNNRIVLPYEKSHLKILNIRHNITGEYLNIFENIDSIVNHPVLLEHRVDYCYKEDNDAFIKMIPKMTGIEGFVCEMSDGTIFKIKTNTYKALHHLKDTINSSKRLYEAVLNEATDDLKSMFYDDTIAIGIIESMELFVKSEMSKMIHIVENFYNDNKHLDRREYAIKGQKEIESLYFPLIMNMYIGRKFCYTEYMLERPKKFGIKETENIQE